MQCGRGRGGAPDSSAPDQGRQLSGSSRPWSPMTFPPHLEAQVLSSQVFYSFPDTIFVNVVPLAWLPDPFLYSPGNLLHIPNRPVQVSLLCKLFLKLAL